MALWCSVREAQRRISSSEFTEWLAFWRLEPWGCGVDDARAGMIASVTASCHGARCRPSDFIPDREPAEPQTEDQILALVRACVDQATNG